MKSIGLLILLFCNMLFFNAQTWASDANKNEPQFNFDDDYQGEDNGKKSGQAIHDPLEIFNRQIFNFNEFIDKNIALPVVRQYHKSVPQRIRTSASNFVNNISAPFSAVNSLIQGDGTNAMASFSAFLINSTVGVVGLFDVAGEKKIKYNQEDLGQSLGRYGSKAGAYLVVPFFGPSDARDFSGFVVERIVSPLSFNSFDIGGKDLISNSAAISLTTADVITTRESLIEVVDDIRKNSFDPYSTMRSAYLQRRESLILNK